MEVPCHPSIVPFAEASQRRLFSAADDRALILMREALESLRGKEGDELKSAVASIRTTLVTPLKEARFLWGGFLEYDLDRVERFGARVLWPDPPAPCPPGYIVTGTTQSGKGVLLSDTMAETLGRRVPRQPPADADTPADNP